MFKKALSFFLVFGLIFGMSSCADRVSCSVLLSKALAVSGEDTDGNGYIYFSDSKEGSPTYFPDQLYSVMYGEGAKERYFSKIEDFAIFISQRTAGELAVFRCYSSSECDDIARMCLDRADEIKVALRGSEYEEKSRAIKVGVYGHIVAFYFVENVRKAEKKLKGLI